MTRRRDATEVLTHALVVAATQGQRTPCSDIAIRDRWVSEHEKQRRQAARWCSEWQCPVLTDDRSFRPGKKLRRSTAA
jgi:hypothetical protein